MSDYISKSAVFEVMSDVFNSYGNNALNFDEEETKAIERFCAMLQSQIAELPTLDEKEIIRKTAKRIINRLEYQKEQYESRAEKFAEALNSWEESRNRGKAYSYGYAIEIVKEECGISV